MSDEGETGQVAVSVGSLISGTPAEKVTYAAPELGILREPDDGPDGGEESGSQLACQYPDEVIPVADDTPAAYNRLKVAYMGNKLELLRIQEDGSYSSSDQLKGSGAIHSFQKHPFTKPTTEGAGQNSEQVSYGMANY
ncbi:hypothetical protein MKZ38_000205 [Zalerion maritima]|uniref:Uncharacterized protein n=1 Tax=Zalerion maritima TaxID=339359 RepID=A0AAD5RRU7_9PEZI|nr:hypothetical protein MKZ38_000205 [Zalerion maritima]